MGVVTNASAELKVDGATVTGDANSGWLVTFSRTGDEFTVNSNGDITQKDSSTNVPDTNTKLFNISFKDPSKIDWSGVNISAPEALIIEKENGDKRVIVLDKDGDNVVLTINSISSEYKVLEGENDVTYKYYEEKGKWIIKKITGSNSEVISSMPNLERTKILPNHTLYSEEDGETQSFDLSLMSEANKAAVLNITTVTQ